MRLLLWMLRHPAHSIMVLWRHRELIMETATLIAKVELIEWMERQNERRRNRRAGKNNESNIGQH